LPENETTLNSSVSSFRRLQHGAGGRFDGLFFAGKDGTGDDAALWWGVGAASGRFIVAAGGGGHTGFAARAAGSARNAVNSGWWSGFDGADRAFRARFVWSSTIGIEFQPHACDF
jgi:hypothetical protein